MAKWLEIGLAFQWRGWILAEFPWPLAGRGIVGVCGGRKPNGKKQAVELAFRFCVAQLSVQRA